MKLLRRDICRDGQGFVSIICENAEDIWHAYNLVHVSDIVQTTTFRKVQQESSTGSSSSCKVRTTLSLQVESTEYDAPAAVLRVKGRNIEENQYVKMGAYHTVAIETDRKWTLTKSAWDSIALERVSMACDPAQNCDLAAVVMQEGIAHVCLITTCMTVVRAKIDQYIPKKRKGGASQHDKGLDRFFETVLQAMLRHIRLDLVKCVIIASPGFVKDQFHKYLVEQAVRTENKLLIDSKDKFLLTHASSGFKHSLKELLLEPAVLARVSETRAAGELKVLDQFCRVLQQSPARAYYGLQHVQRASEAGAVQTLLVSDRLFRSHVIGDRKQYVSLVDTVKDSGASVYIFSSMHVSGEKLDQMSGVAAILRYPMPEIDSEEEEEEESAAAASSG